MLSNTKYISPIAYKAIKEVETVFKQDNTMKDCTSSGVTSGGISYDVNSKQILRGPVKPDTECSSCNTKEGGEVGNIDINDIVVQDNNVLGFLSSLFGFKKPVKKTKPLTQNASDYAVNKK
jgi:hypothetical protein